MPKPGSGKTATAVAAGLFVLASAACTRVRDHDRFPATEQQLEIVDTFPREGDSDVHPDAVLQICLSGYLNPRTIDVSTMRLASGEFAPYDTHTTLELFSMHERGDLSKIATEPWCPGSVLTTRSMVKPSPTVHRMWIVPSVVGWAGELLDTSTPGWSTPEDPEDDPVFIVEFLYADLELDDDTTDSGTGEPDTDTDTDTGAGAGTDTGETPDGAIEPPPTLTDLFAPGAIFASDNPACSCHREPGTARDLVDLRNPDRAYNDLVRNTTVRSTGFAMVSPRSPAESFLVHVLLRNPDGSGLDGLRGSPMPPDGEIAYADLVAIARWIDAGAPY